MSTGQREAAGILVAVCLLAGMALALRELRPPPAARTSPPADETSRSTWAELLGRLAKAQPPQDETASTAAATGRLLLTPGTLQPVGELGVTTGPVPFAPLDVPFDVAASPPLDPALAELVPVPQGNEVILGVVRDALGFPLAGAHVEAHAGKQLVGVATTDGAGRFEVHGLAAGHHDLRVSHASHPTVTRAGVASGAASEVDVVMPLGGGIEALVRDARSYAPLDGAHVVARGPDGRRTETFTAGGVARLAPLAAGRWTLAVERAGYATVEVVVDVPAAGRDSGITVRDLRIELAPGATIGGVVLDGHGDAVAGAEVRVGSRRATTGHDGRFRVEDVAAGDLEVTAAHPELGQGSARVGINAGGEVLSLQLRLE